MISSSVFYGKKKRIEIEARTIPEDSEDSCLSDSGDEDYELPRAQNLEQESSSGEELESPDDEGEIEVTPSTSKSNKSATTKKASLPSWRSVGNNGTAKTMSSFQGRITSSEDIKLPINYFRDFFDDELLANMVEQSNLFAVQKNPNRPLCLKKSELEQFFGTVIYMSIFRLPRSRMFWAKESRITQVADLIRRDRWEEIKRNLHVNDNTKAPERTDPNRDKLYKIRPLIDKLLNKFLEIPQEQMLSVDEQMVPFKGHSGLKQYLPNKPNKWGYKIFIICDTKGLVNSFEIFTGKINKVSDIPDLGSSSNIVLKLVQNLQRNVNHLIYFDNWFSSLKLLIQLSKMGFQALGTIRINRFPGLNFSTDAVMKKRGRGSYEEKEATVECIHIRAVKWFDNRGVTLASTFSSAQPTSTVQRWDRKSKRYVEIVYPQIVQTYNSFMGGVDTLDTLIAYYRIHVRSKKWYHKLIFHFLDLVIVSAWLLYRRDCAVLEVAKKHQINLLKFRASIAESLCKEGKDPSVRKRGRPSTASIQEEYEKKKKRGPTTALPSVNIRTDGICHWPIIKAMRQRCKRPKCKGQTNVACDKCQVNLCLNKHSNCFKDFHRE